MELAFIAAFIAGINLVIRVIRPSKFSTDSKIAWAYAWLVGLAWMISL